MRGAEQHRLPAQRDAGLAMVEQALSQEWDRARAMGRLP